MVELVGRRDEFLRILEDNLEADILVRGNEITFSGEGRAVEEAAAIVRELLAILGRSRRLDAETVQEVLNIIRESGDISPEEVFSDVIVSHRGKVIAPKTTGQKGYIDAIRNSIITFAIGPAGTGKTYLGMAMAVRALKERQVGRIILTRPAVEAGEKLGYLPGDLYEKIDPYLRPLFDALFEMMEPEEFRRHLDRGTIEIAPLAYMRGRTLNDSFIILDEAQNTTPEQMKMFLTRLGFGSKVVVTGDVTQVDLPRGDSSGLVIIERILGTLEGITFIHLTSKDVVRHKLVQRIVEAYRRFDEGESQKHPL